MTLGQAKERLKQLLDESKPKADLTGKLDRFFDMGQKEVALYYPIYRTKEYAAGEARALPGDFFRGCQVVADGVWHAYDPAAALPQGAFTLRYEARPADIPENAPDSLELEVAEEAASAVLFYVAAQCNSMEYDQRFFQSFYAQYQGKMVNLAAEQQGPVAVVEVSGDGRL